MLSSAPHLGAASWWSIASVGGTVATPPKIIVLSALTSGRCLLRVRRRHRRSRRRHRLRPPPPQPPPHPPPEKPPPRPPPASMPPMMPPMIAAAMSPPPPPPPPGPPLATAPRVVPAAVVALGEGERLVGQPGGLSPPRGCRRPGRRLPPRLPGRGDGSASASRVRASPPTPPRRVAHEVGGPGHRRLGAPDRGVEAGRERGPLLRGGPDAGQHLVGDLVGPARLRVGRRRRRASARRCPGGRRRGAPRPPRAGRAAPGPEDRLGARGAGTREVGLGVGDLGRRPCRGPGPAPRRAARWRRGRRLPGRAASWPTRADGRDPRRVGGGHRRLALGDRGAGRADARPRLVEVRGDRLPGAVGVVPQVGHGRLDGRQPRLDRVGGGREARQDRRCLALEGAQLLEPVGLGIQAVLGDAAAADELAEHPAPGRAGPRASSRRAAGGSRRRPRGRPSPRRSRPRTGRPPPRRTGPARIRAPARCRGPRRRSRGAGGWPPR